MEFIKKKLKTLPANEKWDYGNGFTVYKSSAGWSIHKHGMHVITSSQIEEIAREVKLTFIAIEVTNKVFEEAGSPAE